MNDLNLRVSGGIGEKVKKPAAPISTQYWSTEISGGASEFSSSFFGCNSADNQLKLLKQFLNVPKNECDEETIRFLVLLFWHADAKHPVKGFLRKHLSDSETLRQPFTEVLTSVISTEMKHTCSLLYTQYIGTIPRLDACVDKFPPGAAAVSSLEMTVATYLVQCLEASLKALGISTENTGTHDKPEPLAPTEINKIYDLTHLTLRLLLYMIQKVTDENRDKLNSMFECIRSIIAELMSAKEAPMDTKSVSGIVYLTMHLFENGPDSWVQLLETEGGGADDTARLAVLSALVAAVPAATLAAAPLGGRPALLALTDRILALGDRFSADSSHTLAVARTILAISKCTSCDASEALLSRLARFCWGHMDHHMDSVRHLAAQAMGRVVRAAARRHRQGSPGALEEVWAGLGAGALSRRSHFVALSALAHELGAELLARRPRLLRDVFRALSTQAVQACATTFLETLLDKHMRQADTETIYRLWVVGVVEAARGAEPAVLRILQRVLARAVRGDARLLTHILPEERALSSFEGSDLKCVLLVLGVVRKSGITCNRISFEDLMHTAYDADDEIRILALSLAAESPRSTEPPSAAELAYVLHFLDYNINAQAPGFRQLVLANVKKILKRLEDSYKVLKRSETEFASEIACYVQFVCDLRVQCFASLVAGAGPGRRRGALQVLAWLRRLQLEGHATRWTEEQADALYGVLEDSYEGNRALALDLLERCPPDLIKAGRRGRGAEAVLAAAARAGPAHCAAAAHKLLLLRALPGDFELCPLHLSVPEHKSFGIMSRILSQLKQQAALAADLGRAARDAPMYGLVHCLARLLAVLDARSIAGNAHWSSLVRDVIATCEVVNARVAAVVTAASPEGLLPDHLTATQTDTSGDTRPADGRAVTAQMLLLCAWRSVKETSLLLGSLVARLELEGEAAAWTLSGAQVEHMGALLAALLARLRHRGAFEQAYVGFSLLLGRLWKCRSPRLHQLPLQWFSEVERALTTAADARHQAEDCCATRRGAGLPFMVQALVTTELAAEPSAPRGRLLARAVALCLRVGGAPSPGVGGAPSPAAGGAPPSPEAAARAHLVLRALFRHAAPGAEHTQEAIMLAVRGFEADTWMERNSATLLFAALQARVFGVLRARMTGRVFFLRYPKLYDFLLEQVESAGGDGGGNKGGGGGGAPRPALLAALLLLGRLQPSALDGTVSNLKLERFLPALVRLAGAADAATRRRAAQAAAPLLPPHRYLAHIQSLLTALGEPAIKRNLGHGLLCQLVAVLELNPELCAGSPARGRLAAAARGTFWAAAARCPLLADEWLRVLNLMLLRFPKLLDGELAPIATQLEAASFRAAAPPVTSGREVFLANAAYMLLIIRTILGQNLTTIVMRCLLHGDYEVNLAALNYLLVLHNRHDDSCQFLDHLSQISNRDTLQELQKDTNYVKTLCIVTGNEYLECKQKALQVLALTDDTQRDIVKSSKGNVELSDEVVTMELIDRVRNEHASLTLAYLESLLRWAGGPRVSLDVIRVLQECSAAGREEAVRGAAAGFLRARLGGLVAPPRGLCPEDKFEWVATVWATAAMLLEDDACAIRQRAAAAVLCATHGGASQQVIAAHAARLWRRAAAGAGAGAGAGEGAGRGEGEGASEGEGAGAGHRAALLLALAALDFRADVDSPDELGDEYRVFEQNETHNVYLEEFTWTRDCAVEFKRIYRQTYTDTHSVDEYVQSLVSDPLYKGAIERLCVENVAECLAGRMKSSNPKIDIFLKILHE